MTMAPRMPYVFDDGGRMQAGYKGFARDCVARSIAIVTGRPYGVVYAELSRLAGQERNSGGATARNGINTHLNWFKTYMRQQGFTWTPTMRIGSGCHVHLAPGELPPGRLVVRVSKHCTAVIDGVIHDTHDPQRSLEQVSTRCVYGYWTYAPSQG